MKIAITSEGNSLDSKMDSRFGRCAYFAIYDTNTKTTDFFENPAKDSPEGAGPKAVEFIASKGVKKVVAGEFGGKAKALLEKLNIEMQQEKDKTISEIIKQL
ncbi:MAG: dinitrogenase iron-molybdenum cofactor biosynthesis protein [Bacteroidales bacterium]|jgi:predicted Fe-Mo cluster-binding NifX family protein|nr:dinitrogenase iron-molybdenum cofactor biosynthesis protein [Bacteroidales bacterium]